MKAHQSIDQFRALLSTADAKLPNVVPQVGFDVMLRFYRDVRAVECDPARGHDMLLFQWGTYDWGQGSRFEIDITRQFILEFGEDVEVWQLSLTFVYPSIDDVRELGEGNRWCEAPTDVVAFQRFIEKSPTYKRLAQIEATDVELDYEDMC